MIRFIFTSRDDCLNKGKTYQMKRSVFFQSWYDTWALINNTRYRSDIRVSVKYLWPGSCCSMQHISSNVSHDFSDTELLQIPSKLMKSSHQLLLLRDQKQFWFFFPFTNRQMHCESALMQRLDTSTSKGKWCGCIINMYINGLDTLGVGRSLPTTGLQISELEGCLD